MDTVNNFV